MALTITQLRLLGFEVKVHHYRPYRHYYYDPPTKSELKLIKYYEKHEISHPNYIYPTGGYTIVELFHPDDPITQYGGRADCSFKDNYNKKVGTSLALQRAIDNYESYTGESLEDLHRDWFKTNSERSSLVHDTASLLAQVPGLVSTLWTRFRSRLGI